MKKGGRVSAEEKRARATQYFLENPTIFNLKELESQLSRHKGIISQTVKDLVEELVIDNVIEKEKQGSGNYFWCFPSKSQVSKKHRLVVMDRNLVTFENNIKALEVEKMDLLAQREPTPSRMEQQRQQSAYTRAEAVLDAEQSELAASDPSKQMDLRESVTVCRTAANRWTENVYQLVKFYKNRLSDFNTGQFQKHFNQPEDMEEI